MFTRPLRVNLVTQILTVEGKEERKYQLSFEQLRKKSEKHKMKPKGSLSQGCVTGHSDKKDFLMVNSTSWGRGCHILEMSGISSDS